MTELPDFNNQTNRRVTLTCDELGELVAKSMQNRQHLGRISLYEEAIVAAAEDKLESSVGQMKRITDIDFSFCHALFLIATQEIPNVQIARLPLNQDNKEAPIVLRRIA